ncbi:MAG: type II toxin-antitoxin system HicB family antitoxin [Tannerella sp.]|jgi:predicted RNase H-like HicB family nuclease|nr:type II toxin-antitoxin system HicB family antitoxin [Tannerella sp.]
MKTKKIKVKAIIEKASDGGYGIYLPDVPGYVGIGYSEEDAKKDLREAIDLVVEDCRERGIPDDINGGAVEFDYRYDLSGFLKRFDIFNVSALAKTIGINSGLMRQYKAGKTHISEARKQQIETRIHTLADELSKVKF